MNEVASNELQREIERLRTIATSFDQRHAQTVKDAQAEMERWKQRHKEQCDESLRLAAENKRLETRLKNAPHGALCKRGLQGLYDAEAKCTCYKAEP